MASNEVDVSEQFLFHIVFSHEPSYQSSMKTHIRSITLELVCYKGLCCMNA